MMICGSLHGMKLSLENTYFQDRVSRHIVTCAMEKKIHQLFQCGICLVGRLQAIVPVLDVDGKILYCWHGAMRNIRVCNITMLDILFILIQ